MTLFDTLYKIPAVLFLVVILVMIVVQYYRLADLRKVVDAHRAETAAGFAATASNFTSVLNAIAATHPMP